MKKRKCLIRLIVFIILLCLLFFNMDYISLSMENDYWGAQFHSTGYRKLGYEDLAKLKASSKKDLKLILVPADPCRFGGIPEGQVLFKENSCPVQDCVITKDRQAFSDASAIIFLSSSISGSLVKSGQYFPPYHPQGQYWIFANNESPYHLRINVKQLPLVGIFNWTMSYLPYSDIYWPYGRIIPLQTRSEVKVRSRTRNYNLTALSFKEKRMAAWFVSHCHAKSKREVYVEELRKYIPVDIYGLCGKNSSFTCPEGKRGSINMSASGRQVYCQEMLEANYKFYLAFENIFCPHYITEKVFNTMEYDIIPIVMGLNGEKFSDILPPHSHLDIMDFASPKHLAEYMLELAQNETKFQEYFNWKKQYRIACIEESTNMAFCELCQKLHQTDVLPKSYNLSEFIHKEECDLSRMDFLREKGRW